MVEAHLGPLLVETVELLVAGVEEHQLAAVREALADALLGVLGTRPFGAAVRVGEVAGPGRWRGLLVGEQRQGDERNRQREKQNRGSFHDFVSLPEAVGIVGRRLAAGFLPSLSHSTCRAKPRIRRPAALD